MTYDNNKYNIIRELKTETIIKEIQVLNIIIKTR